MERTFLRLNQADSVTQAEERRSSIVSTRGGWVSFLCAVLVVAFIITLLNPTKANNPVVFKDEANPSIPDGVVIIGFEPYEERLLRKALARKFTRRCGEAYEMAGLMSPSEVARTRGIVIRPARDLWLKEHDVLGLVYKETRIKYQSEFSSGWAQAGTVPAERYGVKLTVDGRARVFLYDSAFAGEAFLSRRFSLEDVLSHELQHVGGQGKTPGWLPFTHDLKGFGPHDTILENCR
jgi:hypothetical protein